MLKIEKKKQKNGSLYLFIYFAYCYETYRQINKIPRLQSAQINFNNWILCTTKSCQPSTQKLSPHFGLKKKSVLRPLFRFQLPLESRGLHSMALHIIISTGVILKRVPWLLQKKNSETMLQNDFFLCCLQTFNSFLKAFIGFFEELKMSLKWEFSNF